MGGIAQNFFTKVVFSALASTLFQAAGSVFGLRPPMYLRPACRQLVSGDGWAWRFRILLSAALFWLLIYSIARS
jgi:hypothetical protein